MSEEKLKPLSDEDVERTLQRIAKANVEELNDIYRTYANTINSMISVALKQTEDESDLVQLERLKRIINLTPEDERFIRSKDKIWNVREHILNKNAKYFLEKDYNPMFKKDHNQSMLESLVEIIKDKFDELDSDEQLFYWKKAATLLNCVVRFKKAIGEYDE